MKWCIFTYLFFQILTIKASAQDFSSISSILPKLDAPIGNYQNIPAFNPLLDVNENHGQFRTEISLPLPANNLKFSLRLKYNSDSHSNVGMGQGWDWELPFIEKVFAKNSLGEFKFYGLLGSGQLIKTNENIDYLKSIIQQRFSISLDTEGARSYRPLVDENMHLFLYLEKSSRFIILTQEGKYFLLNRSGNLEQIRDYFGNAIDFSWDGSYLTTISSPVENWKANFLYTEDSSKQNSLPVNYRSQIILINKHLSNLQLFTSNQQKELAFFYTEEGSLKKVSIKGSKLSLFEGSYSSLSQTSVTKTPTIEDKKTLIFKDSLAEPELDSENADDLVIWTDLNNDGRTDKITFFTKEYFDKIRKHYSLDRPKEQLQQELNQIEISSEVDLSVSSSPNGTSLFQASPKLNLNLLGIRPYRIEVEGQNNHLKFIGNRIEFIDLNNDGLKDLIYAEGLSAIEDSSAASYIAHHFNSAYPLKGTDPFLQTGNMASVYLLSLDKESLASFQAEFKNAGIHDSLTFLFPKLYEWQKSTLTFPCHQETLFFDANNDGFIDALTGTMLYLNKGTGIDFFSQTINDPYSLFEEGESKDLSSDDKIILIDQNRNGRPEVIKGEKILRYPLTGELLVYGKDEERFLETKSENQFLTQIKSPFGGATALNYIFTGGKWSLSQIEQISNMAGIPNLKRIFNYFNAPIIDALDGSFIGYSKTEEKIEQIENGKNISEIPTKLITKTFSKDQNSNAVFLFSRQRLSGKPLTTLESGLNSKNVILTRYLWANLGDKTQFIPYLAKTKIEEIDEDGNIYRAKTLVTKKNYHFTDHYYIYDIKQTKGLGLDSENSSDFDEENALEVYTQYAFLKDKYLILPLRTIKKDLSSPTAATRNTG